MLVLQEATKKICMEGIKELLYADDLLIMVDSEDEMVEYDGGIQSIEEWDSIREVLKLI